MFHMHCSFLVGNIDFSFYNDILKLIGEKMEENKKKERSFTTSMFIFIAWLFLFQLWMDRNFAVPNRSISTCIFNLCIISVIIPAVFLFLKHTDCWFSRVNLKNTIYCFVSELVLICVFLPFYSPLLYVYPWSSVFIYAAISIFINMITLIILNFIYKKKTLGIVSSCLIIFYCLLSLIS